MALNVVNVKENSIFCLFVFQYKYLTILISGYIYLRKFETIIKWLCLKQKHISVYVVWILVFPFNQVKKNLSSLDVFVLVLDQLNRKQDFLYFIMYLQYIKRTQWCIMFIFIQLFSSFFFTLKFVFFIVRQPF